MNNLQFVPGIHWGYTLLLIGPLGLLLLAAGVAIGAWAAGRRNTPPATADPASVTTVPDPPGSNGGGPAALDTVTAQRAALVGGCIEVRKLLHDQVLAGVLDGALDRGGIEIMDPTGTHADSARHRIAGTDPAAAPAQDGVIARTLAPGFVDAGRVLRAADVVVYKWEQP
ncbi:nucleotide exchange factor GrpE [Rhodococcus koreensis]